MNESTTLVEEALAALRQAHQAMQRSAELNHAGPLDENVFSVVERAIERLGEAVPEESLIAELPTKVVSERVELLCDVGLELASRMIDGKADQLMKAASEAFPDRTFVLNSGMGSWSVDAGGYLYVDRSTGAVLGDETADEILDDAFWLNLSEIGQGDRSDTELTDACIASIKPLNPTLSEGLSRIAEFWDFMSESVNLYYDGQAFGSMVESRVYQAGARMESGPELLRYK